MVIFKKSILTSFTNGFQARHRELCCREGNGSRQVIVRMNKIFVFLIVLSGLTIWNSGVLGVFSLMRVIPSFPLIGRLSIWIIIAVYLLAVVDVLVGSYLVKWASRSIRIHIGKGRGAP